MTIDQLLSSANEQLDQSGKQRHVAGTTSGAGASNGTTFVATGLTGVDDAYNEMEIRITSGDNSGQRRIIGDWDNATNTGTLIEPFVSLVANGVTFEIGEKGVISNHHLIELFTEAQDTLITLLVPDAFPGHTELLEVTGTAGVSAALPVTLGLPPRSFAFKDGSNNEYDVVVIPPGERDRFLNDAFLGSTLNDMIAFFENGLIRYKPVNNGTLMLPVIPQFGAVTYASGSPFPSYLHHLLVKYAVWKGWERKERVDVASRKEKAFYDAVNGINGQSVDVIKYTTMGS